MDFFQPFSRKCSKDFMTSPAETISMSPHAFLFQGLVLVGAEAPRRTSRVDDKDKEEPYMQVACRW
jgi:hypothetical protein